MTRDLKLELIDLLIPYYGFARYQSRAQNYAEEVMNSRGAFFNHLVNLCCLATAHVAEIGMLVNAISYFNNH